MIACGALAREILDITKQLPADLVELTCLPAAWHNHPEKIVPGLKRKVDAARSEERRVGKECRSRWSPYH